MFNRFLKLYPLLLLLFFWFLYFSQIIIFGKVFYNGDNDMAGIPFITFFISSIVKGEFPLWNPQILGGIPFFMPTNIPFFPFSLLFFFTLPEVAMSWNMILISFFAGLGMYLFVIVLLKNKKIAFYSALIYTFSGMLAKHHGTFVSSLSIAYLPFVFLCFEKFLQKRKYLYSLLAGLVLFLGYISGHPMLLYITILSCSIYLLFSQRYNWVKRITGLFLTLIIMLGLSSVMLIPQIELRQPSTRPESDFNYATSYSIPPKALLTMLLPHLFGIPEIEIAGNIGNVTYLGILPLIFILLALISGSFKKYKTITFLGIIGLLLSLGKYSILYKFALFLPGLKLFRQPGYFLLLYVFAGSILAGVGLNYLLDNLVVLQNKFRPIYQKRIRLFIAVLFILSFVGYIYLNLTDTSFWQNIINFISSLFFQKSLGQLLAKIDKIRLLSLIVAQNILTLITLLFLFFECFLMLNSKLRLLWFIIIMTFLDLFFINQSEFFLTDRKTYEIIYSNNHPLKILQDPNYRFASIVFPTKQIWKNFNRDDFLYKRVKESENTLSPNRNMLYQTYSTFGFSTLMLSQYNAYLSAEQNHYVGLTSSDISYLADPLAKAGARYLLSNLELKELSQPRYQLINSGNNFYLYEDNLARKRTFLLNKDGWETGFSQIIKSTANSVTIVSYSKIPADLILLDNYYPGWEAKIDGMKTTIYPFENTFRKVELQEGTHEIEFYFQPRSFIIGLTITVLSLLILIISLLKIQRHGHVPKHMDKDW